MRARAALFAIAMLVLAGGLAVAQEPTFTLADPSVFHPMSRPGVVFPHAEHQTLEGVSCLTCHHEGDTSIACASCHKTPGDLQRVFHLTCIACHDEQKRQGRVTGPRECGECHVWGK